MAPASQLVLPSKASGLPQSWISASASASASQSASSSQSSISATAVAQALQTTSLAQENPSPSPSSIVAAAPASASQSLPSLQFSMSANADVVASHSASSQSDMKEVARAMDLHHDSFSHSKAPASISASASQRTKLKQFSMRASEVARALQVLEALQSPVSASASEVASHSLSRPVQPGPVAVAIVVKALASLLQVDSFSQSSDSASACASVRQSTGVAQSSALMTVAVASQAALCSQSPASAAAAP